jgi:type VI secretion system secreted protein VgrG
LAKQVDISIKVGSTNIKPFTSLVIKQVLNDHHFFELRFNHDVVEKAKALKLNDSKDLIGQKITINFNALGDAQASSTFIGVVTSLSFSNNYQGSGDIILSGFSSSILLETTPNNTSYEKKKLKDIVAKMIEGASTDILETIIKPKQGEIPFQMQYGESNFAFIRRLAAEYGEWFFYNGKSLIFGENPDKSELKLVFPKDITDYDINVNLKPVNFQQSAFLSKENKQIVKDSSSAKVSGLDELGKFALQNSEKLFSIQSNNLSPRKFKDAEELNNSIATIKANAAADMVNAVVESDRTDLKLGGVVKLSAEVSKHSPVDYGSFIITSITHRMDGLGNYSNNFEGIPASVIVPPNPHYHKPLAESQLGEVISNKDPDNLGRIKVKLQWMENDEELPWLRVMTPSNGTRNGDKANRGIFFTPEVGDQVMIGFTQNDPDRPFVMGSLPHGKAIKSDKNTDNQTKAIRTRSGATIYFHDKEKSSENEILIETDKKNYISIKVNNNNGDIKIFSSKAIEVNSQETIVVKSGKSIDVSSDSTINVKSNKITIDASDSIEIKANKKIEMKALEVDIEGSKSFSAKGVAEAKLEGTQLEVKGSATAKVSGGVKLDLSGGAMSSLTGAIVKIN